LQEQQELTQQLQVASPGEAPAAAAAAAAQAAAAQAAADAGGPAAGPAAAEGGGEGEPGERQPWRQQIKFLAEKDPNDRVVTSHFRCASSWLGSELSRALS
jgi:hypothetical protein